VLVRVEAGFAMPSVEQGRFGPVEIDVLKMEVLDILDLDILKL